MHFCPFFTDGKLCTVCFTKEAPHYSFRRALYSSYFEKVFLMNSASTWHTLLKHYLSVEFLLVEGYLQGVLRKELHIAPFVELFKTATLRRSFWWALPVLGTNYLNIAFLLNFCWWNVIYRVLYERSFLLLLS